MSIQVLITTMQLALENTEELLKRLNISSDFIIGNQTDIDSSAEIVYGKHKGIVASRKERGVGNNRNITLKYATSDICMLSDDDMCFVDDYTGIVESVFRDLPDADAVVFNLGNAGKGRRENTKIIKLNRYNYMNYGAARMAFRRKAISYNGIFFNTNFGGGTTHSAGEDVLFIGDCIKKGLQVYAVPQTVAYLTDDRESTWFNGYTEKYLYDKGVFLAVADSKMAKLMALYLAIRHREYRTRGKSVWKVYTDICRGIDYITKREFLNDEN